MATPRKKRAASPVATEAPRADEPLLKASDFRGYLAEKAALIAPRDVESLLQGRAEVIAKIGHDCAERERTARQLELALDLLGDHATHRTPQIPYSTVSVLAAAVLYFMNPLDVIPDLIPGIGTSDDALVVEMAFKMAAGGIERYCVATERPTADVLGPPQGARRRRR